MQYLKSFTEPIPFLTPLNIISEVATPVSMAFRHYGNVLSGYVISISVSRVGSSAQLKGMKKVSGELKLLYSQYLELKAFAQFGSDLDADTKARLALGERIVEVLKQKRNSPVPVGCQVAIVYAVIHGYLDSVPVEKVQEYENELFKKMKSQKKELMARLEQGFFEDSDINELESVLKEMQR